MRIACHFLAASRQVRLESPAPKPLQCRAMIGISKLYCGTVEPADPLRYGRASRALPSHLLQFSADKKPVVVYNCTRRCNLRCVHCYCPSADAAGPGELTTDQAEALLDDLAGFGCPVVLFSGGEPLVAAGYLGACRPCPLRRAAGGAVHQRHAHQRWPGRRAGGGGAELRRGQPGRDAGRQRRASAAWRAPSRPPWPASHRCQTRGVKVGLRLTVTAHNVADVPAIFDLLEERAHPTRLLLSPSLRRPGNQAGRRRPDARANPVSAGPDHGPHRRPPRRRASRGGADRRQPRRRAVRIPAAAARRHPAAPPPPWSCCG